jgi:PIN domain nuclease of toxin-antitoxin system
MSQVIVLDTHIWLWFINGNTEKIPERWLDLLATAFQVGISPVSCYEIALAHKKGRLILPTSPKDWFDAAFGATDVEMLPLTSDIADRAVILRPTCIFLGYQRPVQSP